MRDGVLMDMVNYQLYYTQTTTTYTHIYVYLKFTRSQIMTTFRAWYFLLNYHK